MRDWGRRIGSAVTVLAAVVIIFSLIYRWALLNFEGIEVSIFESVQVVIEILTTAGFGGDANNWTTDAMNLVVIGMNLTGVILVFLALPMFVVPLFKEALAEAPPESTDLTDHVIICSHTARGDVLGAELEAAEIGYTIIDDDQETVLELIDAGVDAIHGNVEREGTLEAANIGAARTLIADVSDERNLSVILTARELNEEIPILSVAESRNASIYHRYAGADRVVRPRQVLGRSLGQKVTLGLEQELQETVDVGSQFELSEVLVQEGSELAGQTIGDAGLLDRIGATVIAVWSQGEFIPVPDPEFRINEHTILLVAGSHAELEAVNTRTVASKPREETHVVLVGYGGVGRIVADTLDEGGVSYTVVDTVDGAGVDVVGDITDSKTRVDAAVDSADYVVLALDDDTAAMYTTVALEHYNPDTEVVARADDRENMHKLYRAGAEYVLALTSVTGRMLSSIILETGDSLSPGTQFDLMRSKAPALVGQTLAGADVRGRTGATVVAVERDEELLTNPGPDFAVREEDVLIVAGSTDAISSFIDLVK